MGIEPTGIPEEKWFTATFVTLTVPAVTSVGGLYAGCSISITCPFDVLVLCRARVWKRKKAAEVSQGGLDESGIPYFVVSRLLQDSVGSRCWRGMHTRPMTFLDLSRM